MSVYIQAFAENEIEFKKKKALNWYTNNVEKKKFYGYDPNKHINFLKARSLRWYEANSKTLEAELSYTKKKALKWYERNIK